MQAGVYVKGMTYRKETTIFGIDLHAGEADKSMN